MSSLILAFLAGLAVAGIAGVYLGARIALFGILHNARATGMSDEDIRRHLGGGGR